MTFGHYLFLAKKIKCHYGSYAGSVALDGVSLTVNAVDGCLFSINIIPHTWSVTGWAGATVGQKMNMEIDMLARYVARLAEVK